MTEFSKPKDVYSLTPEKLSNYSNVLLDRDGVLGHHGQPIDYPRGEHINNLILECPWTKFIIVTNGNGEIEPISADVVRTPPPRIKQFRPRFLKNLVEEPKTSLFVTDSLSETAVARISGFNVFYIEDDSLQSHPFERIGRKFSQPIRPPLKKLVMLGNQIN